MTIKPLMLTLVLVVFGWLATLATVGLLSDEAPAQIVLFPSHQLLSNLPAETSIVRLSEWSVTLESPQSGFARTLYERGAWIVFPSGLRGCFPL